MKTDKLINNYHVTDDRVRQRNHRVVEVACVESYEQVILYAIRLFGRNQTNSAASIYVNNMAGLTKCYTLIY